MFNLALVFENWIAIIDYKKCALILMQNTIYCRHCWFYLGTFKSC